MRKSILLPIILVPFLLHAQIGIKGGYNFSNATSASAINPGSRAGFVLGLFLAPPSHSIISSRTEIEYSRQGYSFGNGTTSGNVNLDYLIIPQFMAINITKFVQIQVGAQMAFLLNAKADSTTSQGMSGPYSGFSGYTNKFDYGFGAGVELHPVGGLVLGARFNIGLNKIYSSLGTGQAPSFSASDAKNNVVSVYTGWIFGKRK